MKNQSFEEYFGMKEIGCLTQALVLIGTPFFYARVAYHNLRARINPEYGILRRLETAQNTVKRVSVHNLCHPSTPEIELGRLTVPLEVYKRELRNGIAFYERRARQEDANMLIEELNRIVARQERFRTSSSKKL